MLRDRYRDYLIERGYKEFTPSGHPSTVYDYVKRIDYVCDCEAVTWEQLAERINEIEQQYEPGGPKDYLGAKSHGAVVNALRRFEEFCHSNEISQKTNATENSQHKSELSEDKPPNNVEFNESPDKKLPYGFYRIFFGAFFCWIPFLGLVLSIIGYATTKDASAEELPGRSFLGVFAIVVASISSLIAIAVLI